MNHITGAQRISFARQRQIDANRPAIAIDILTAAGADIARAMDLLTQQPVLVSMDLPKGDLLTPKMVKIGADGLELPEDAEGHVAVLFPQYGRMFDVSAPEARNWDEANELGSQCRTLGYTDWYLNTDREAGLWVDRRLNKPACDQRFFPKSPTNKTWWTSTPYETSSSGYAWGVCLYDGSVDLYSRVRPGFVRACRLVPASQ